MALRTAAARAFAAVRGSLSHWAEVRRSRRATARHDLWTTRVRVTHREGDRGHPDDR